MVMRLVPVAHSVAWNCWLGRHHHVRCRKAGRLEGRGREDRVHRMGLPGPGSGVLL